MKRVITLVGEDGRSRIMDAPDPEQGYMWPVPGVIDGADGRAVTWSVLTLPPDEELHRRTEGIARAGAVRTGAAAGQEVRSHLKVAEGRPPGWHSSETLDFLYVLEGSLRLMLDEDTVDLEPGDCVIQQGTVHCWSSLGETPVRICLVMIKRSLLDQPSGVPLR